MAAAMARSRAACVLLIALSLASLSFVPGRDAELPTRSKPRKRKRVALRGVNEVLEKLQQLPSMFQAASSALPEFFSTSPEPLSEVSSFQMRADGLSRNGLIQSFTFRAAAGREERLLQQLGRLRASAKTQPGVLSAWLSQSTEDPRDMMFFLRYEAMESLVRHQDQGFKGLLSAMEENLQEPIGLYLADEQLGQIGQARHPLGPGGEGGRDDAIYSSRRKRR
ncbi:Hypothetical protein SCF082_LOCUS37153 [Durusdinium trenchii]|uniref:ABM domain-containing protein n=1 Tax=Durusdinium trenchii TaxID=1381693 RepID=A0ABP0PN32_9DINO